jgi:trk system potassium uptake protein TrkH
MNYAIVFRLLGYILMIEGALLLLPAAASLIYGEWMVLAVFLLTAAVSAGIGFALRAIRPRSKVF